MPVLDDDDCRLVEAAATGISGAAAFGDLPYVRQRHDELLGAVARLERRGLPVAALRLRAQSQLRACLRGDVEAARRLAADMIRLLTFLG